MTTFFLGSENIIAGSHALEKGLCTSLKLEKYIIFSSSAVSSLAAAATPETETLYYYKTEVRNLGYLLCLSSVVQL